MTLKYAIYLYYLSHIYIQSYIDRKKKSLLLSAMFLKILGSSVLYHQMQYHDLCSGCNPANNFGLQQCSRKACKGLPGKFFSFNTNKTLVFGCMFRFMERSPKDLLTFVMWESLENLWRMFAFKCIKVSPTLTWTEHFLNT